MSGTLAKPEISKMTFIRFRWPILGHGKSQFLQGCRSLSHFWSPKSMLKVMVLRQEIITKFEILYCYGLIRLINIFGSKSFRYVFMVSKISIGVCVFGNFPLPQHISRSTRPNFRDPKRQHFLRKNIELRGFYTATVVFTYFLKT